MNRLQHDKLWRKQRPWSARLWALENKDDWRVDNICSRKDYKDMFDLIHTPVKNYPAIYAHRLFLSGSEAAVVGSDLWAVRFALAPAKARANRLFPSPSDGVFEYDFAGDEVMFD